MALTLPRTFGPLVGPIPTSYIDDNFTALEQVVVGSIAELRTVPKTGAGCAVVLGYAAQGDGGGGWYYYNSADTSSADNGGTIIVAADGGRWYWASQGRPVNVCLFGADKTGATDSTAAFNLATQASATWSTSLEYNVEVPPGRYLINGTVYVRKGQVLYGGGAGCYILCTGTPSATPNFVLGGNVSGTDPGGMPAAIQGLFTIGGGGGAGVVKPIAAGFQILNMFMSSPGIGIDVEGTDGLIAHVQIDQPLTGILFGAGTQNIQVTNFDIYLPNYGMQFGSGCHDIAISNGVIEYAQYASMLWPTGASTIRAINVSNVNFTMNAQYSTFLGFVVIQSNSSEGFFTGCGFRNMYNWAVNHNTGVGNYFTFGTCIFDGTPTSSGYTASTTAKVLNTPNGGASTYDFNDCEYRNLLGEIATLTNSIVQLKLHGGLVANCPQTRLNTSSLTDVPKISVKDVTGFAYILNTGTNQSIVLPFWGPSVVWKVGVRGNTQTSTSASYAAAEEAAYSVTYQVSSTYVDKVLIWQTPSRANPGQLAAVACFGTAAGGAVSQAGVVQSGTICVSVPTSSASNFDWAVETLS